MKEVRFVTDSRGNPSMQRRMTNRANNTGIVVSIIASITVLLSVILKVEAFFPYVGAVLLGFGGIILTLLGPTHGAKVISKFAEVKEAKEEIKPE